MTDIPGSTSTTATITVGGSASDMLDYSGDHDWFAIQLIAGQKITVSLDGFTLEDPYLRVYSSAGALLAENDDISPGRILDSKLVFTAPYTGTFYIDAGAWEDNYSGNYQLNVDLYTPPPAATYSAIADHLTSGYWAGDSHHFSVTQGGTITYDFHSTADANGVTAAGQTLAREALALWSDITGVTFVQVPSGGQITFADNEDGAFSEGNWSNGIISSAHVNVSTDWLTDYGTTIGTYSFQTYIHEIGHALGLGHGGFYNSTATFEGDASFSNDGWPATIMSYFDQDESVYFNDLNFTNSYIVTPMLADIRAMGTLYGLSTTTRTGDTTYGFGNNSGRAVYTAAVGSTITALTISDSGGIDTLNYSGFSSNQVLNLNQETFSNVGGGVGNVAIGFGTVIENAIGGYGADTLVGSAVNNSLNGGAGSDVLTGGGGADTFIGMVGELNGDTITDFTIGDQIVVTGETLSGFTFSLSGSSLTVAGAAMTLTGGVSGHLVASAAVGGVALTIVPGQPANDNPQNDFNGDGRSDILWRDTNGVITDWLGTADGGFVDNWNVLSRAISNDWQVAGTGDFNGDGRSDILWRDTNGVITNFLGTADGDFVDNWNVLARAVPNNWQIAGTGDFNGDGRDDILWRDINGVITNFLGTANGGFVDNWHVVARAVSNNWQIEGIGDFNGDGRDDILWRDTNGVLTDFLGAADGGFVDNWSVLARAVASSWQVAGTGDFNGDGRDDILWRNANGVITDWLGTTNGGFVDNWNVLSRAVSNNWEIAATGDFNGDGRDDILWRDTNGVITNFLGTASGGFVDNWSVLARAVPISWHVQTEDFILA